MTIKPNPHRHPCFNVDVKGVFGRVHLPVAPRCNIMCNYCNRKYDCVNESRPGVTSAVLSPAQSVVYMDRVLEKEPRISTVGIAGPGDPMANPQETLETIRLLREKHPGLLFCLSSNGLALPGHLDDLAGLGVTHVTVTINAVDPDVGSRFYRWVRDGRVILRGREAAALMLERQIRSIKGLKERGITVKVNTIVCPGKNEGHVVDVARTVAGLGADILNLIPLHPTEDTDFEGIPEPGKTFMSGLQSEAEAYIPQMRHCKRCRADAVGLLDRDRSGEFAGCLAACASSLPGQGGRPHVAVATMEGLLVNKHLGEAEKLQIWTSRNGSYDLIEERWAPEPGGGSKRWEAMAETLKDCRVVLVSGVGQSPKKILESKGIMPLEVEGFIEEALRAVYTGQGLAGLKQRHAAGCGVACSGGGEGC